MQEKTVSKTYRCKCGSTNLYVGITHVECGENPECENYSERQAKAIRESNKETLSKKENSESQTQFQFEDDYDSDDEDDPYAPFLSFWGADSSD